MKMPDFLIDIINSDTPLKNCKESFADENADCKSPEVTLSATHYGLAYFD